MVVEYPDGTDLYITALEVIYKEKKIKLYDNALSLFPPL